MSFNKWRDIFVALLPVYFTTDSESVWMLFIFNAGILFVINIIVKHFLYSFHIVDAKSCVHMRVKCFAFNQNMPKDIFVKDKNEMKIDLKSFYFYENI